jgi:diguanylate cyclase (GGDEF)-like protein
VRSVRAVDLVARLAGDEFVIVFEHVERAEEAEQLAAKIVAAVRGQFIVAETAIKVTTSIGLAMYDGDCDDMQDGLIARADAALYAAKRQGRDCFVVDKVTA